MISLEIPKKLLGMAALAHHTALSVLRPVARKYDDAEHSYPTELDMLGSILQGMEAGGAAPGAQGLQRDVNAEADTTGRIKNGRNMGTVINIMEMCWGDVGLTLSVPGQGLGNAAIGAVGAPEQKARFGGRWAAMAITENTAGSDSGNIATTAVRDGDEYVLNGEKIFVTAGERADLVVVWATLDKNLGKAAIKPFIVEKGTPGFAVVRLEKKLGIRASDTATLTFTDCRVPKENLLGSAEVETSRGFGGVMRTFDNTRPAVAAMAVGVSRASLDLAQELLGDEGLDAEYEREYFECSLPEAELYRMEAELEAARLLTLKAAWMADNNQPNSKEASMAKAKAARVASAITLRCVELCGPLGYSAKNLLEKWARDSKILDIFEGTQQIQQLIVARQVLGKGSRELR